MSATSKIVSRWPEISSQIKKLMKKCSHCTQESTPRKRTPVASSLTRVPLAEGWIRQVHTQRCQLCNSHRLLLTFFRSCQADNYDLRTHNFFTHILWFRILEEVVCDKGPQYASQAFQDFAKVYNFKHTTSSPHFPQNNGHTESSPKQ